MNGAAFSIKHAAAFVAAIDAELEQLTRNNVELVKKGRQTQQEADYVVGLIRDIRSDLVHAFGELPVGGSYERTDPAVAWSNKVRWIKGELELREATYPEAVRKGRMTREQAAIGVRVLATLRRLYWSELFMWDAEAGPALEFQRACRAGVSPSEIEAKHGEGRRIYRELVSKHAAAVQLEDAEQGRLVA